MDTHPTDRSAFPPDPLKSSAHSRCPQPAPRLHIPHYRVVLLNNTNCDMMFVVRTIMELTRLCRTEALLKMWQAHYNGRASVLVTYKERAELFVELFTDRGLTVAIEPS
jgi:ATP-dependent Clp protease adapter protein ClpS